MVTPRRAGEGLQHSVCRVAAALTRGGGYSNGRSQPRDGGAGAYLRGEA